MTAQQPAGPAGTERPKTSMEVIKSAFGGFENRTVLDVGCGTGSLAAALIKRGARVVGIDPNQDAVEATRRAVPGGAFQVAPGQALPFDDGEFDGAIFLNSLHHIPQAAMAPALVEAARVTGPGSVIVIIEPLAKGSYFEVMRPIEDETEIRAAAQNAIEETTGAKVFSVEADLTISRIETISDIDSFLAKIVAIEPSRAAAAKNKRDEVIARLNQRGERTADGMRVRQPLRAHVLRVC